MSLCLIFFLMVICFWVKFSLFVILFIIVLNVSNVFLHLLTYISFIKFDLISLVFSLFFLIIYIFHSVVFKLSSFTLARFYGKTKWTTNCVSWKYWSHNSLCCLWLSCFKCIWQFFPLWIPNQIYCLFVPPCRCHWYCWYHHNHYQHQKHFDKDTF